MISTQLLLMAAGLAFLCFIGYILFSVKTHKPAVQDGVAEDLGTITKMKEVQLIKETKKIQTVAQKSELFKRAYANRYGKDNPVPQSFDQEQGEAEEESYIPADVPGDKKKIADEQQESQPIKTDVLADDGIHVSTIDPMASSNPLHFTFGRSVPEGEQNEDGTDGDYIENFQNQDGDGSDSVEESKDESVIAYYGLDEIDLSGTTHEETQQENPQEENRAVAEKKLEDPYTPAEEMEIGNLYDYMYGVCQKIYAA